MSTLTIEEAARRLGLSQTSVRRRLRAGTLRGERRPTPQGYVWLIDAPADGPRRERRDDGDDGDGDGDGGGGGFDFRDHYITHLEDEVSSLRRVVDALRREG
jgi:excisionase family DNA binding protein